MTRRILLFILLSCIASRCAVTQDHGVTEIALDESAGKLFVNPGFIEIAPQSPLRLSILSPFQPECKLHGMDGKVTVSAENGAAPLTCKTQEKEDEAGPSVPYLEFSHGSQSARVMVVVVQPAQAFSPMLALLAVLLTAGAALLALWQWRRAAGSQLERAMSMESGSDLGEVHERLNAISSNLYPGADTRARRTPAKATQSREQATAASGPGPSAGDSVRARIERFVAAARNWCQVAGTVPRDVETNLSRVQGLLSSGATELSQFQEPATIVCRLILNVSDDRNDFQENQQAEEALQRLLKIADLDLIHPRQDDSYNPELHKMLGSQGAPGPQFRGRISRVTRRGLRHQQSLLSKAEVYVYD